MYPWRYWIRLLAGILAVGIIHITVSAQTERPSEYAVKAAYLFNFARFVEWPNDRFVSDDAPIVIGVLGDDPFGDALNDIVDGRSAQGRPVRIRRHIDRAQADSCHIVFVEKSMRGEAPEYLANLASGGVLTVGDWKGFSSDNGIIEFVIKGGTVRFRIRLDLAESGRLKLSSKLLRVGEVISQ